MCCAKSLQSYLTPCDRTDCSLPDSSVHGILQARILQWVAMPSCRGSSQTRDPTHFLTSPALAGGFFTTRATPAIAVSKTGLCLLQTLQLSKELALSWKSFLTGFYFFLEVCFSGPTPFRGRTSREGGKK